MIAIFDIYPIIGLQSSLKKRPDNHQYWPHQKYFFAVWKFQLSGNLQHDSN